MRPIYRGLMLATLAFLPGCEVGPDYVRPPVDTTDTARDTYKESGDWKKAQPHDAIDRGMWWSVYRDPLLDALEKQVDISNQNLKAAQASYEEAMAVVAETRSALFPSLTLGASANMAGTNTTGINSSITTYNVGPTASWAPDVWGRIRRAVESDEANARASAADVGAARLSAQAALATDYFDLRVQDDLRRVLDQTVQDDAKILKIVQNQYTVGVAAKSDVLSAQTQLESVQSQAINVGVRRAQLEHAIAVLVGRPPSGFAIDPEQHPSFIPDIPAEMPSALLERRPDIAAAERQMIAANAQIGVAKAAWYPNFTISASYGFTGTVLTRLIQASNSFWTVGPAVAETIFDAGQREAQVEQAEAGYAQTVANYRQTVLTGFQQVEDNLAAQRILGIQQQAQDAAVLDARKAVQLTLNQYREGIVPYNNVLTAQITALSNEQAELSVKDSRLDASVALIQALGGGWDSSQIAQMEQQQEDVQESKACWFFCWEP